MPSVIINEKDRTIYNAAVENTSDNIVYVPGITSTGPTEPTLVRDYATFIKTFGGNPNTSSLQGSTWEYAANILLEGLPVLFHRIKTANTTFASANATFVATVESSTSDINLVATAKFAGTLGNSYSVSYDTGDWVENGSAGTLTYRVSAGSTILENGTICEIPENTSNAGLLALINTTVNSVDLNSDYVEFSVDGVIPSDATVTLPTNWTSTIYTLTGGADGSDEDIATVLADYSNLTDLLDKDIYDFKFLTSGGVTAESELATMYPNLVTIAETRGTCIAILDAPRGLNTPEAVQNVFTSINSSYAQALYSWAKMSLATSGSKWMAPSYVYMIELAKSIDNSNPVWMPIAGVNRGLVPECQATDLVITSSMANIFDTTYPHINPIRYIRNYGYAIYGQKTLLKTSETGSVKSAFEDLNVRIIANEIKRYLEDVSVALTFEGNNLDTWLAFHSYVEPYLASLKANGGLVEYQVIMDETTTTEDDINNNIVRGVVIVQITRLAEEFSIDFIITNNAAEFIES